MNKIEKFERGLVRTTRWFIQPALFPQLRLGKVPLVESIMGHIHYNSVYSEASRYPKSVRRRSITGTLGAIAGFMAGNSLDQYK